MATMFCPGCGNSISAEEKAKGYCPGCGKAVLVRDWYEILSYALTPEGRCRHCDAPLTGRYEAFSRPWGRKRVPVRIAA